VRGKRGKKRLKMSCPGFVNNSAAGNMRGNAAANERIPANLAGSPGRELVIAPIPAIILAKRGSQARNKQERRREY